jgi:hypothetical protein
MHLGVGFAPLIFTTESGQKRLACTGSNEKRAPFAPLAPGARRRPHGGRGAEGGKVTGKCRTDASVRDLGNEVNWKKVVRSLSRGTPVGGVWWAFPCLAQLMKRRTLRDAL